MSTISNLSEKNNIAEVRVGSDSDYGRLVDLFEALDGNNTPYIKRVLSAHRTPSRMIHAAQNFPKLSLNDRSSLNELFVDIFDNHEVMVSIAAAGGSAHLAGMTASETDIPIIAVPVTSSALGIYDALRSMVDMPGGVPNGMVVNQRDAAKYAQRILDIDDADIQKIFIPEKLVEGLGQLIDTFGIEVTTDPTDTMIGIFTHKSDVSHYFNSGNTSIPIVIPTVGEQVTHMNLGQVSHNIEHIDGLTMGVQKESNIRTKNAFLYAMKLIGTKNKEVKALLASMRNDQYNEVMRKDIDGLSDQREREVFTEPHIEITLPERYERLHTGKVRDTFQHPENPDQLIMIASDRISTHDYVHNSGIPKKGSVLTKVSNYWFDYFKTQEATKDIPTQFIENAKLPEDFPEEYKEQVIVVKKLNPVPIEAIVRARFFGSIVKKYDSETGKLETGEFVGKGLIKGQKFDELRFTPSTKAEKGAHDMNINVDQMENEIYGWLSDNHPNFLERAEEYANQIEEYSKKMFETAEKRAAEEGIIIADTKFEFAIDDDGVLHIIDEILTPDSSRFWRAEGYAPGNNPDAFDKQPVRDEVVAIWKKKGQEGDERKPVTLSSDTIGETVLRYKELAEIFTQ